jgi:putative nucleotidyltransferase with HDIG domain
MPEGIPVITVRELLAGDVKLASPPESFVRITALLDDPRHNLQDITRLIEQEPGLSARLLKIVNSAFYGFPARIATVAKAITVLGNQELRDLVLATLVIERFSSLPNGLMSMRQFWMYSIRCALFARFLADRHPEGKRLQPVFICGLLHDIGRLVIYHRLPELARAAVLLSRHEQLTEQAAQRRVIGLDHYRVGAELARQWRLPEIIAVTIERHDAPTEASQFPLECLIAALASRLAQAEANAGLVDIDPAYWQRLDLSSIVLDTVIPEVDAAFNEIFRQFFPKG